MDEEVVIINSSTRNEKIKNFFIKNKKILISLITIIIILIVSFFVFEEFKDKRKVKLADQYNNSLIKFKNGEKTKVIDMMKIVVNKGDKTYSPLALYFLIDNQLIKDPQDINKLFDIVIEDVSLQKEIKNLIIYKKALYNADDIGENELLKILKPIINSESVWKSHALYLIAEYFFYKGEKQKSIEFFNQIISLENANQELKIESQKRLNRDLSE